MRKVNTLWRYIKFGLETGADWRSRWLLATMLPRLKVALMLGKSVERLWHATIRLKDRHIPLFFRTQDIFLLYEIFVDNPYIPIELKKNTPKLIVDLGAHIGLATLQFKAHFPEATIHCYEPNPENFRLLERNTQSLGGVVLHQEAVGAVSGKGILYIPGRHSAGSLVAPVGGKGITMVNCEMLTLDEILQALGSVDLIKFDIEGVEYEVFRVSNLVHKVPFIVGEMKTDEQGLKRFLSLFQYHLSKYRRVSDKVYYISLYRDK